LATLPERKHREQTQICRTPFGVWALTRWRLGFHFFGEDLWEWLTLCPKTGPFAQIAQTFGMVVSLSSRFEPHLYHKSGREANASASPRLTGVLGEMYSSVKAGMNRQIAPLVVLVALLFLGACSRPLATGPLAAGVAAAREDRWEEAVRYWKMALETSPDSAAAHNNLAVAYEKQGAFDEAGREYEAALRLAPGNSEIRVNYEAFKARLEAGRKRGP